MFEPFKKSNRGEGEIRLSQGGEKAELGKKAGGGEAEGERGRME